VKLRPESLYRVPLIRYAVARLRYAYLKRRHGIRTLDEHDSSRQTIEHNKKSLVGFNTRNERLLFGTLLVEDIQAARVLIIGCRSEEEILMFRGYGFVNITALDLLSYSPWVQLGDMHHMPYADGSFDMIFCSYTLSYSENPKRAACEMLRVIVDGGIIAIAAEYAPHELRAQTQLSLLGYQLGARASLDSTAAIRELFEPHVTKVFVDYDAEKKRHHTPQGLVKLPSPLLSVFAIGKQPTRLPRAAL
jgi:SAM-dependent methyltransferase